MSQHTSNDGRRSLMLGALGGLFSGTRVWAQNVNPRAAARATSGGRLVVVMLRGAVDGLNVVVPHGDPNYAKLRPSIAIAPPDGTAATALALDSRFGLHPALASLMPFWRDATLAFVPAAGLPKPNRSHFDAQRMVELGGAVTASDVGGNGLLNGVSQRHGLGAVGVGEANPVILSGSAAVRLIARGRAATRTGVIAKDEERQTLLELYAGDDELSKAFRQGAQSRRDTAAQLKEDNLARGALPSSVAQAPMAGTGRNDQREMLAASNGAQDALGFALDAQHLCALMRTDAALRLGFVSVGGWDTHANQGAVQGQLANSLSGLAAGLVTLREQFNRAGDVVLVMSEFGRTAFENGTRGTDHGFGNAIWLMGPGVNGGKIHGEWTGLGEANLNESRDLPAHHDFRAVLAQVLRKTLGTSDRDLADLLPGGSWDRRLDALMRP